MLFEKHWFTIVCIRVDCVQVFLVNNWVKKTMVRLHDGILCIRLKEVGPTFCNSMDGTGEHYAK